MLERQQLNNQRLDLAVGAVDSLNITAIFIMFLTEVMRKLLEETAHFILFPVAMAASLIQACLAWRQAKLENGKNGTVAKAIITTLGALAVSVAVVGGLVAAATFATVAPLIFSITLGLKSLFHIGAVGYYWGKSVATKDPTKEMQYQNTAKAHAVGAVALILATVAVSFVMLAAKPIVAVVGIVAGTISGAFCFYNLFKSRAKTEDKKPLITEAKKTPVTKPSQSAGLYATFRPNNELAAEPLEQNQTSKPTDIKYNMWEKIQRANIPNKHRREYGTAQRMARSL